MHTDTLVKHPVRWEMLLREKPESYWLRRGEKFALALYQSVARRVPAYKQFIGKRANGIRTMEEFRTLPLTSKDSYLRAYPWIDLSWFGALTESQMTIAATSGSTGEPFYFPRTREQDMQYAAVAEMYLRTNFAIHKKRTLYVVGWGMGVWIGGVFSYQAVRIVSERGNYALSVITPGTSPDEIIKAVIRLGPFYDQIIIGGYPPMIKDLLDEGQRRAVRWKDYPVKFIFSAEGFSEAFRDYVIKKAGLKSPYLDTLNHYGTVDLGTMAHETPIAILIRRISQKLPALNEALFGNRYRQPTLAQYIPELFYFEAVDGGLVCSARSGLPLVRYNLIDTGGIKTLAETVAICLRHGVDLYRECRKAGIAETVWNLPFVYVFERSDFTVKLSGANIFPQEVRRALESRQLARFVTGKCTMEVGVDAHMDQVLHIHVEMKPGVRGSAALKQRVCDEIVSDLRAHNSEYAYLFNNLPPSRMIPIITLWERGSTPYFGAPGKHKWVRKPAA